MNSTEKSPNVFGMVTTAASREYTPLALRSFFRHTPLEPHDRVILIDNDSSFELPVDVPAERITVVRPAAPQGFAANGNYLLGEAKKIGADLFFLNNDLVFTHGWLEPLLADRPALLSPLSNAQVAASADGFATQPCMDLAEYTGHEAAVEAIAASLRERGAGYQMTPSLAFFCVKIPRAVYEKVGNFDERFGKGGGEDRDYAVRAWIAGIPQEYALQSYVLHFQGRSTWRGAETPEEQAQRDAAYSQAFQTKWGAALTYAFLGGDWNLFRTDPGLARFIDSQDYTAVVRRLRSRPALEPFIERQQNATFAAVCCIYDDDSWLPAAFESVYDACQTIWFLVGERPWNGAPTDQTALLARLQTLPDPASKVRIVRGEWPDEATQRNDGMRLVGESGADYCFVLDADEIYDPAQLEQAMTLVRQNPQVDAWGIKWFTYWKSYRYRVDPPEPFAPIVFVRVGTGSFVENRVYQAAQQANIPAEVAMCHHMSYARTDEQILRKISTFSHAHQIVSGWYENVWRKWDANPRMENVHPCWPGAYRRIVEQPAGALPPVLRKALEKASRLSSLANAS
jgi:GT2 family glycosyltransferase